MADVEAVKPLQYSDSSYWREAINLHNASLKKGTASKKYIHVGAVDDAQISANKLMATAMDSYQSLNRKESRLATVILQIQHSLHRYARVIDTFIQSDPTVSALVWGSIRLLLQIAEEEERASRLACEGIMEILHHVGRWEQVSHISQLLESPSVPKAVVLLYTRVLDFLISSTKWLEKSPLGRKGASVFRLKADKFEEKLRQLRLASELVDKEIQTRATFKNLRSMKEVHLDMTDSIRKIEGVMKHVQQLSSQTEQLQLADQAVTIGQNAALLQDTLAELKLLPVSIANTIFDKMESQRDLTRIKEWLKSAASETSLSVHPAEGTCQWLLQDSTFLAWATGHDDQVLWAHGPPGCGKSVMAGYLHENFCSKDKRTLFYRFQRSASSIQSTPLALASDLICQLLGNTAATSPLAPAALDRLQGLTMQFPLGSYQCSFRTLWKIAVSLILQSKLQYRFIIDAFDECSVDGPSLPSTAQFLNNIAELVRITQCRVMIFSRPEPKFSAAIRAGLSINMGKSTVLPDIMIFAESQYEKLQLPGSKKNKVMEQIRSSSHGSFRWTDLFLGHLGQACHAADFQARILALPSSIGDLYKSALLCPLKKLSAAQMECRGALLLMNFNAQRTLKVSEMVDALSLWPESAAITIMDLCRPLVNVEDGFVQFSHPSVREFLETYDQNNGTWIGVSMSDSHGRLAEKCLASLMNNKHADLEHIETCLRKNYAKRGGNGEALDAQKHHPEDGFYNYASQFWTHHLTQTKAPGAELLRQVNAFLASFQFVFWSEYHAMDIGYFSFVVQALDSLKAWHSQLPEDKKALIDLAAYAELPYERVITAFRSQEEGDPLPRWLAMMSLGDFYFHMGFPQKLVPLRERVSLGLRSLLGPRHPLSLFARANFAYSRFHVGKMRTAQNIYTEVTSIQRSVLGQDSMTFLWTMAYRSQSEFYMADFTAAAVAFTRLSASFLRLSGPGTPPHLTARLWYALSIGQLGQLDLSRRILQTVFEKRREQFGRQDTFATVVQIRMADVLQHLGQYGEAIDNLLEALVERRGTYLLSDIFRLDVEIALAKTYLAAGMSKLALALLDDIEEQVNFDALFERLCTVRHLRGLLLASEGGPAAVDQAIAVLQAALIQIEPDQNNRELLWVRLDLADLLRRRNSEGDQALASIVFDNLVKDVSGDEEPGFPDEPDPPRLLDVAERALRLVRGRNYGEAQRELDLAQADWRRPSDFWLWITGGFFP